jgi:putative ABC transport system permease protein
LTAIDALLFSMSDSFNRIGANSYSILPGAEQIDSRRNGRRQKQADEISFREAYNFKEKYTEKNLGLVSVSLYCGGSGTVSFQDEKTNPTVKIVGVDETYLSVANYDLAIGRNFNAKEIDSGTHIAIIGKDIVKMLFKSQDEMALGQVVKIDNAKYKVVGVLADKGSTFSDSGDRRVFIPVTTAKKYYANAESNFQITASVLASNTIDQSSNAAIGIMRNVRKINIGQPNDFRIRKSDGILNKLKDMTSEIRLATMAIAFMTLLGAAIGLMNIMLVSVTERTKEIGLRKAVGAPSNSILFQFLVEAVFICLIGGVVGILMGIALGNGVALIVGGKFILPINWIALGIFTCVFVGVISGIYPAYKASRLDPIESLRYE